jgi:outer membrane biosynthesis protein TonB
MTGAWIAIGAALLLGVTIGAVVMQKEPKDPKEPASAVQHVPVVANAPPQPLKAREVNVLEEAKIEAERGAFAGKKGVAKGSGAATDAPTGEVEGKGLSGLKGLSGGLAGLSGPGAKGPDSTTRQSGAGQLDSAQVQTVVARYSPSVKRSCWQPALDTRDKDAPSSARVVVTIAVTGSGSVQDASTSGDPRGYRGLATCIAARVRGWQFPASGDSTTVNVPFVFAAQ